MKKKLLLLETEMNGPGGHYLDNLLESFYFFKNDFDIYCLLNKKFSSKGTFIPDDLKIDKILNRNNFEKKENKSLYVCFELISILKRFLLSIIFIPYFLHKKNLLNYFDALLSNGFILPRYFLELFFFLKKNNFSSNDHIFFQTTRNKHMALANFLSRIKIDIPKVHLRILYTPSAKRKFGGFYYFLRKIKYFLNQNQIFLYVLTQKNLELFIDFTNNNNGIFKSNIPWVFYDRAFDKQYITIGYMGDARESRGFNLLPELIEKLQNKSDRFKFLIQYSKVNPSVKSTSDKLHEMCKTNPNIEVLQKYLDYKEFRETLQIIDIMPILHSSEEINNGNPSTIYSSITHQIPMTLPSNLKYMKDVLTHKSYEESENLDDAIIKIIKIKDNYKDYLSAAKKNSLILANNFRNDPLRKNIN